MVLEYMIQDQMFARDTILTVMDQIHLINGVHIILQKMMMRLVEEAMGSQ